MKELLITLMLEKTLSQKRIFELNFNIIEWGPGVFGNEAAAQRRFHKPTTRLTPEEGTRLAAFIPSPFRRRPTDDNDYVNNKAELILNRMSTR